MTEKILGYVLIVIGLIIIAFSGYSVYSVFALHAKPIQPFNFPGIKVDFSQMVDQQLPVDKGKLQTELVSADILNSTSNLIAHVILFGFLASLGYRIALIGAQIVRPINIHLKSDKQDLNITSQAKIV